MSFFSKWSKVLFASIATLTILSIKTLSEPTVKENNCLDDDTCFGDFFIYIEGASYENMGRLGEFSCALYDFDIQAVDLKHYQSLDNYLLYETVILFIHDLSTSQTVRPEFVPPQNVNDISQFSAIHSGFSEGVQYESHIMLVDQSQVCRTPNCYLAASIQFLQYLHNVEILPLNDGQKNKNKKCRARLQK